MAAIDTNGVRGDAAGGRLRCATFSPAGSADIAEQVLSVVPRPYRET
jgi:hypothetical protein